ncbi:MAG: chromate resistance protein [Nitrosomonadales bacterium]|nr:chromate resistance protein [Nitrosomonadales bacterium]
MKWITRECPKIDRIACPWLVSRFVDESPEFLYVPANDVMRIAAETGAIPYDVPDVELGHHGDRCSFDACIAKYAIKDAALDKLALIVRAADTGKPELAREAAGLLAISKGLSLNFTDDHEMLQHGMVIYDALYAWCSGTPSKQAAGFPGLK